MASTDDLIRQILEESKQRQDRAGAQNLGRGGQPHRKKTTVLEDIKSFKEPLRGLADAFAGALRGSVAGTVGFPGDLESLGRGALSALGAPSGARLDALISGMEQPTVLPTTERMRKVLPKATAYDNPYEELGTFMPLPGSTAAARLAGKGAAAVGKEAGRRINEAMLTGDGMLGAALAPVKPLGMDVWHGSPHKFAPTAKNPLGEFDASKIGTGEGAQAYGHGHYLAELKDTGQDYAKNLANRDLHNQGRLNAHANAQRLASLAGDPKYAADDIRFVLSNEPDHPQKTLLQNTLSFLESGDFAKPLEAKGHLYKVDLPDEHIAKMLDWDKPLSQQPEVLNALTPEKMGLTLRPPVDSGFMAYVGSNGKPIGLQMKNTTPEKFREAWLKRLQEMGDAEGGAGRAFGYLGGTSLTDLAPAVSQAVRQAGIPGIRYLDQGSRGAGQGTSNYVVFPGNEDLLTIKERMKKGGKVKKAARKASGGAAKQLVKINPLPKSENLDAMRLAVMDKKLRKHHA